MSSPSSNSWLHLQHLRFPWPIGGGGSGAVNFVLCCWASGLSGYVMLLRIVSCWLFCQYSMSSSTILPPSHGILLLWISCKRALAIMESASARLCSSRKLLASILACHATCFNDSNRSASSSHAMYCSRDIPRAWHQFSIRRNDKPFWSQNIIDIPMSSDDTKTGVGNDICTFCQRVNGPRK